MLKFSEQGSPRSIDVSKNGIHIGEIFLDKKLQNGRFFPRDSSELTIEDLEKITTIMKGGTVYDQDYGDQKICKCGHIYERHFDSYDDMRAVGCKYCDCYKFKEKSK